MSGQDRSKSTVTSTKREGLRTGSNIRSQYEVTDLHLWLLSKQILPEKYEDVGLRLNLSKCELETICHDTGDKMTFAAFKMFTTWSKRQSDGYYMYKILLKALRREGLGNIGKTLEKKLHIDPVYTKHPSRLEDRQLQEIADNVPTDERIHLGLRLGLSAVRIEEIEHDQRRNVNAVKYQILVDWRKNLEGAVDQGLTLTKITGVIGIVRVARMIRQNHLTKAQGEASIDYGIGRNTEWQPPEYMYDIEAEITHKDSLVQKEAETRVHKAITDPSELVMHKQVMELPSSNAMYETKKLKQDSIYLTFAVYSREGVECLQEDICSGALGKKLSGVFLSDEAAENVSFDVEAATESFADAMKYFERVDAFQEKMRSWSCEVVGNWAREVVKLPEQAVQKLDEVDGNLLRLYQKQHLKEDLKLSGVHCTKLLKYRDEKLESEGSCDVMFSFDAVMDEWEPEVVQKWMKQVKISQDVISALKEVDGDTLKSYTLTDLVEDTEITILHGRTILYLRDCYLTHETWSRESEEAEASLPSSELSDSSTSDESTISESQSFTDNEDNEPSISFSVGDDSFLQEAQHVPVDGILTEDERYQLNRLITGNHAGLFDSSYFPILVTSNFQSNASKQEFIRDHFNFLLAVNWCCVFDFDPSSNVSGMCDFVKNTRPVKIRDINDFENVCDIQGLRSDLEFPNVPTWIFANGKDDPPQKREERHSDENVWLHQRGRSACGAVRFFTNQALIKEHRERVLFLIMSEQDAYAMSQLFREFTTCCPDFNYTVLAKDEVVYRAWKTEVVTQTRTHEDQIDARSIVGGKWISINREVEIHLGDIETSCRTWPLHQDSTIDLAKRDIKEWTDLTVIGSNECENTAMTEDCPQFEKFVKSKKEKFYRGNEVEWWNLHFTEKSGPGYDHVLKRKPYSKLNIAIRQLVNIHLKSNSEAVNIDVVTIFHQPGSGGTTLGKQMLWNFREECRCVKIDNPSSNTVDQLMKCLRHGFDQGEKMRPLLVLLDNCESTAVFSQLVRDTKIKAKSQSTTCKTIIFLHCQRTNEAEEEGKKQDNQPCVYLKHKLHQDEENWFHTRLQDLNTEEKRLSCPPENLLGFMALRAECSEKYFDDVVERLLPPRNKKSANALDLLKYIAIIQKYVPRFAVPVKTCDDFMPRPPTLNMRSIAWEKKMPPFLQIMLIEKCVQSDEGIIQCVATVSQSFARAVVKRMSILDGESQSNMVSGLIDSPIMQSYAHGIDTIKKSLRDLFVHRENNPTGRGKNTAFSRFLEESFHEGKQELYSLLDNVISKLNDPFVAQQLARLYYLKDTMYDDASSVIDRALQLYRNNSFLWDTKGRIYKRKISSFQIEETPNDPFGREQVNMLCALLEEAVNAFKQCQLVSATEINVTRNLAGYEGEVRAIFDFLYKVRECVPPFNHPHGGFQELTTYLTNPKYFPKGLDIDGAYHQLIKSLARIVEDDINFLADTKDQCAGKSYSEESSVITALEKKRKVFFLSIAERSQMTRDHQLRTKAMSLLIGSRYRDVFAQARNEDSIDDLKIVLETLAEIETFCVSDVRTLTFVSFALSTLHDLSLPERIWEWVAQLTKLEEKQDGLYGLFFQMLLCWLSESTTPSLGDLTKKLQVKWNSRYSTQNVNVEQSKALLVKPIKKIPSTEFFLGLKDDQKCLVHKSKKNHIYCRPRGVLEDKNNLLYTSDLTGPMYIRLELPCKSSPSIEAVSFTLGFSFAGPRALDVITCDNKTQVADHSDRLRMPAYLVKYDEQLSMDSGFYSEGDDDCSDF